MMCRWNYDRVDEDGWRWPASVQLQGTMVPAIQVRRCLLWLLEAQVLPLLALCSLTGVHRSSMARIIRARPGRATKIPAFEALALVELSQQSLVEQCARETTGHHARSLVGRLHQAGVGAAELQGAGVPRWVQQQVVQYPRRSIQARYEHLLAGVGIHHRVDCDYQRPSATVSLGVSEAGSLAA